MTTGQLWRALVLCALQTLWLCMAQAQALRDPTMPPVQALPGAAAAAGADTPLGEDGIAVVVRDGKPHLVSGTRLYAVGQTVAGYRIDRITETEVWLRQGSEVRKLPRYAGIQRSVARPPATECVATPAKPVKAGKAVKPLPSSTTSPAVAPCAGAQP